jgi:broad specificity phosphatase PhoE
MMTLLIALTTCLLIRHGETDWNKEGRLQGKTNEAQLTEQGEEQAKLVGNILVKSLKDEKFEIWSSGLARANKTAEIIAEILNYPISAIKSDIRLREADHGRFEGKLASEYKLDPSYQNWEILSPKEQFLTAMDAAQGESYDRVAKRAQASLKEICNQNPDVVKIIVTHGGVINAVRKDITGNYEFPSVQNGEIIVIQKDNDFFSLKINYR